MKSIQATDYFIHFHQDGFEKLNSYLSKNNPSKIIVLVDNNTKKDCLPYFETKLKTTIQTAVIEINAGEIHKNIDTSVDVWNAGAGIFAGTYCCAWFVGNPQCW